MCSSLKFITELITEAALTYCLFLCFELIFTWYTVTFHLLKGFTVNVALHLRWLTTEKFQNYETVKGGCIPSKNKFKTQKAIS